MGGRGGTAAADRRGSSAGTAEILFAAFFRRRLCVGSCVNYEEKETVTDSQTGERAGGRAESAPTLRRERALL